MPAAGEESVQAVLRLFETPSDAATVLCAYNERMHVASKGRSSKQSTFHRDFLGEPCVNQARSVLRRRPTLRRQEEEEAAEETEEEEEEQQEEKEEEEQQQQRGRRAALTARADSAVSGGCGASTISKKTGWRSQPCPG
jgi:hypothetical protein